MHWVEQQRARRVRAAALYSDPALGLELRARAAWRGGFAGGAEWMRVALGAIRGGVTPQGRAAFDRLGWTKYAACALGALGAAWLAWWAGGGAWILAGCAIAGFYLVEVQFVFLFPASLDHDGPAWRKARQLMHAGGGTFRGLATVGPIALRMLAGGLRGWCCGCLEVLLWYEDARTGATAIRRPRLTLGHGGELARRIERVTVAGLTRPVRIAWISDLHLVRRGTIATVQATIVAVRALRPDVIVLGGDLVDGVPGLEQLAQLIRALTPVAPVWALPGNHDERFGVPRVAATVRAAGGAWLPGVVAPIAGGAAWLAAGEKGPEQPLPPGVVIACLHAPARARRWQGHVRLVLAGHLHGGQFILARAFGRFWPCAFFFRWSGPRFELAQETTVIVGSGAGDLMPIRWQCPREIVAVDLVPAKDGAEALAA